MSILIKDMEMPSCCGGCGFSDWSNLHQTLSCSKHYFEPCFEDCSKEYMEKRADFCPLIEINELPPKKVCVAEIKIDRDEVEQLIAEKVEEIKQAICSREMEIDGNDD